MKIKKFNEQYKSDEDKKKETEEQIQLLQDLLDENPISKTHDFYTFIASDKFKETEDGLYKKTIDIENMCRITGDEESLNAIRGLNMRAMFQENAKVYHIWLPKDVRDLVEGKSSQSLEPWLNELINKNKQYGSDEKGKKVARDVKARRSDMGKFNI